MLAAPSYSHPALLLMLQFLHPELLWLLLLLPLVALWRGRRGAVAAVEFSSTTAARQVARETRSRVGRWLPLLRLLAVGCLIVGLARPQLGRATVDITASGIDMILALDVSGSMQSLDFKVNGQPVDRIGIVKSTVSKFIEERPDDRIGLVEFAGEPYLVSPPTLDHDWLQQNLERVKCGTIPDGTAIGSAIAMCANRLRTEQGKSRVVVLLTDGENNLGKVSPLMAAEAARALGIKIYTIGAGVRGKAPFPISDRNGHPVMDRFGNRQMAMIESDVDEDTLGKIAAMTGGKFFRATDTDSLKNIYAQIDHLEKTTRTLKKFEHRSELFAWAVWPGLFVLGAGLGLEQTRYRRLP